MDFINGNKFLEIADFAIDFDHKDLNTNIFAKNAIIFCKTDFLDILFEYIKLSKRKYILISHMSDYPINEFRFKRAPSSIVKWYAQNAIYEDKKLIPVPIGLENHKGTSKGKFTNHQWLIDNIDRLKAKEKINVVYCNWNKDTNREIRANIISSLEKNSIPIKYETGLSFVEYCESMSRYKYVLCPPGNGVDTHRVWEALYMGCIPIVLDNRIYKDYKLPIWQVKEWEEIKLDKMIDLNNVDYKKLDKAELMFPVWEKRIREDILKVDI